MAAATAAPATPSSPPRRLDLRRSLTLRVVAVALACFAAATTIALYRTYGAFRQANEAVADVVARQLEVQLFRIEAAIDAPGRFPDWDQVIERVQAAGQCIRYVPPDGGAGRSTCAGVGPARDTLPQWLLSAGTWLLGARTDIVRPLAYHARDYGTLIVTTETAALLAALWKDMSGPLALTVLAVAAVCLFQYAAISQALRPARDILAGLDRLSHGDLSSRLPDFRLAEFQRVSEVFNALAAGLERTTRERAALAGRLVDAGEQQRGHIARELHDEFAQTLSAIAAAAASIRITAGTQCPTLVAEADRLSHLSMAMMRTMRSTLQALRPPEIDDFGLAAGLAALAAEQERRAAGGLTITLDLDAGIDGLRATTASHVYRIVQEGLTNIGKHADAGRAHVAVGFPAGAVPPHAGRKRWLVLTIEDDGIGSADAEAPAHDAGGFGLIGMRERVMALGGQLEVVRLDRGFRLRGTIPTMSPEDGRA